MWFKVILLTFGCATIVYEIVNLCLVVLSPDLSTEATDRITRNYLIFFMT